MSAKKQGFAKIRYSHSHFIPCRFQSHKSLIILLIWLISQPCIQSLGKGQGIKYAIFSTRKNRLWDTKKQGKNGVQKESKTGKTSCFYICVDLKIWSFKVMLELMTSKTWKNWLYNMKNIKNRPHLDIILLHKTI